MIPLLPTGSDIGRHFRTARDPNSESQALLITRQFVEALDALATQLIVKEMPFQNSKGVL
jgi:hypothetical protein